MHLSASRSLARAVGVRGGVSGAGVDLAIGRRQVMSKAMADAAFVTREVARLKKMMDDGSVAAAKKGQFIKRLNALSSFA